MPSLSFRGVAVVPWSNRYCPIHCTTEFADNLFRGSFFLSRWCSPSSTIQELFRSATFWLRALLSLASLPRAAPPLEIRSKAKPVFIWLPAAESNYHWFLITDLVRDLALFSSLLSCQANQELLSLSIANANSSQCIITIMRSQNRNKRDYYFSDLKTVKKLSPHSSQPERSD